MPLLEPPAVRTAEFAADRVAAIHRCAAAAAGLGTPITVRRVGRPAVRADSMLGLLTLAATHGTELVVAADGDDAGPALNRVAALLAADDPAARGRRGAGQR